MGFNIVEIFAVIMFFISFYGLITTKNAIKSIIFIVLMEASTIMFFLSFGYNRGGMLPPIGENLQDLENVADPLPQALMITAIIIGLAITAINITMLITLFRKVKSRDWDVIKERSME